MQFLVLQLKTFTAIKSLVMGLQEIKRGSPSIKAVCDELSNENITKENFDNKKFKKIKIKNLNFSYTKI